MNENKKTAAENAVSSTVSEYKIGRTTYIVELHFNPAAQESLSDILQRLINRECEKMLGEFGQ